MRTLLGLFENDKANSVKAVLSFLREVQAKFASTPGLVQALEAASPIRLMTPLAPTLRECFKSKNNDSSQPTHGEPTVISNRMAACNLACQHCQPTGECPIHYRDTGRRLLRSVYATRYVGAAPITAQDY